MIGGHGSSRSHVFRVCLHSSIVFCLLSRHTPLFSSFTPWGSLFQVWNLWISMATSIVFLFTLVDSLWSFLKHGCTLYFTLTTSHLLFQVQAAPAPATPMPSNYDWEVLGWHLSSVSTLFGHLGHEKGFKNFHLRINIYFNIVKHLTFDNWH